MSFMRRNRKVSQARLPERTLNITAIRGPRGEVDSLASHQGEVGLGEPLTGGRLGSYPTTC